jgi:thiamine pyrophosphokinase
MKSAAIFVHSRYPKAKLNFYKKLCQGKFKIAVDGGYSFFKQAKIKPDIIIGDFDSLKKESVKGISCLVYPGHKDQTDTELAVRYCIEQKFSTIDIVMPTVGEPDHFLGLVTMLLLPVISRQKKYKLSVRIINHECEIMLLVERDITFTDCKNELLSVLPYGGPIELTCTGLEYPAEGLLINPWQTTGMRNVICSNSAKIWIKGTALVVHYWKKIS